MPLPIKINPARIANAVRSLRKDETRRMVPSAQGGEAPVIGQTYRTDVSTYFTEPSGESKLFYTAENWVKIKLTLETAGPVAVGTSANVAPVLSGHGRLLDTGVEYEVHLARGSAFYIAAEAVNRVSVSIEPIPWMEQISGEITSVAQVISTTVRSIGNAIVGAIGELMGRPKPATTTMSQKTLDELATARLPKNMAHRLTPVAPPKKIG